MAERKLTKSELKMKQRDPKKFAELQKIRARRAKGYKRTLRDLSISPKLSMRSSTSFSSRSIGVRLNNS